MRWKTRIEFVLILKAPTSPNRMQLTSAQKSILVWCSLLAFLGLAFWLLAPVLAPFVVAAVLAYALTPLVDKLDSLGRGRIPRVLAVIAVELLFLIFLLGMLLLLVPILAKELPLMRDQLPQLFERGSAVLKPWLAQWGFNVSLDVESIKKFVKTYLDTNLEDALGSVLASVKLGGSVAFALVGNAVLVPVVLFYLLMEWPRLLSQLRNLVPPRLRAGSDSFLGEADAVLGQYLRGQLMVMGTLAIFYSLGLTFFGLDLALPIGIFTGLAVFVPYLGFGIGLVLAAGAGLLQFSVAGLGNTVAMLVVVYGLGQVLESFVLTPKLVGERIGLHPLAVIFALLAFGQLFGFLGVLVALPLSAVLFVLIRRIRAGYLASPLYLG